jgi:alkanesulfonate monooxygenase SsuD/methylene tetrahydromethanopterin reductase-like flavin-dependent oxidoreductase (luciferase family)
VEIGFHFVNFDVPGGVQALPATLAAAARAAEQAGASWFTMADHFFQMDNLWPGEAPMLEIYTCLGYLAGQTQRIKLVVLVNGVTYHYPGLLAKTATTLDVLSGGRLVFGLGAAWYERECVGLGVPFPPLSERYERLEETLQSVARCGVRTTDVTTESTTSSLRRCAPRNRFSGPTRRSYSREPGSAKPCVW